MNYESLAFIGDLTIDHYLTPARIHYGGASLNSAIWALRAGAERVSVVAPVGDDEWGKEYQNKLQMYKINTEGITIRRGKTSQIEITVDTQGQHHWGEWKPGVLADYHIGKQELLWISRHTAASLTIYGPTAHLASELSDWGNTLKHRPILAVNYDDLSQFGYTTSIVNDSIAGIDIGFFGLHPVNDEPLIREIQTIAQHTGKLMVVTLGGSGAIAFHKKEQYQVPAENIASGLIQDTTGAGDAFLAGFLVEYLKARDVQMSLINGNHLGAQKIQTFGAY